MNVVALLAPPPSKKGRARTFDWDEARQLHAEDPKLWTYARLAERFGVSPAAVYYACNDRARGKNARANAISRRSGRCDTCGKCCSVTFGRRQRCKKCSNAAAATTVRPSALRCGTCKQWKPDEAFSPSPSFEHRRSRNPECRECNTKSKRAWRDRNQERVLESSRRRRRERGSVLRAQSENGVCTGCGARTHNVHRKDCPFAPVNALQVAA